MNAILFEQAICDYLDDKIDKEELNKSFIWLAEKLTDSFDKIATDHDDYVQEAVIRCWEKLPRYDREKGVAWNFFSTIVLCLWRQIYRTSKNYQELKIRYKEMIDL